MNPVQIEEAVSPLAVEPSTGLSSPSVRARSNPSVGLDISKWTGRLMPITSDDTIYTEFLWRLPVAISRFADREFESVAKKVRHMLQRERPSGIFGIPDHSNQWREYCYHTHFGPAELDWAFEQLVDPWIAYRLDRLETETTVILTMAQQWNPEELDFQDGRTVLPDLLIDGARIALARLALRVDCCSYTF